MKAELEWFHSNMDSIQGFLREKSGLSENLNARLVFIILVANS